MDDWISVNNLMPPCEAIVYLMIKKRVYDSRVGDYKDTFVVSVGFYTDGERSEGNSLLDDYVLNYENGIFVSGERGNYVYKANWYEFAQAHDRLYLIGYKELENHEVIAWKSVY